MPNANGSQPIIYLPLIQQIEIYDKVIGLFVAQGVSEEALCADPIIMSPNGLNWQPSYFRTFIRDALKPAFDITSVDFDGADAPPTVKVTGVVSAVINFEENIKTLWPSA